jgi:hypothetical protein
MGRALLTENHITSLHKHTGGIHLPERIRALVLGWVKLNVKERGKETPGFGEQDGLAVPPKKESEMKRLRSGSDGDGESLYGEVPRPHCAFIPGDPVYISHFHRRKWINTCITGSK